MHVLDKTPAPNYSRHQTSFRPPIMIAHRDLYVHPASPNFLFPLTRTRSYSHACEFNTARSPQLKFHAQQPAAASSPVEKCRLDMHFYFIFSVMTFICYLSMVLGGALRWSVVVLCCTQIPTSIGGILALRMWIST